MLKVDLVLNVSPGRLGLSVNSGVDIGLEITAIDPNCTFAHLVEIGDFQGVTMYSLFPAISSVVGKLGDQIGSAGEKGASDSPGQGPPVKARARRPART
ncbi:hypothetical protein THAOC_09909, partial [Thalassiosira oceanica]